jgi:hypothetical protein
MLPEMSPGGRKPWLVVLKWIARRGKEILSGETIVVVKSLVFLRNLSRAH